MEVFGLQARHARAASLAVRAEATAGRDIPARWHRARNSSFTAAVAAKAVGVSRRTLFRWQRRQASAMTPDPDGNRGSA